MRIYIALFTILAMFFVITGCGAETEESYSETEIANSITQSTKSPIPIYDSIEYWEIVNDEIISMLNEHNLYISSIHSGDPCIQYNVAPGIRTEDGEIIASGLSPEEYEELYHHVKEELHIILDKYILAKPKTIFHGCDSIVEIFFGNWYINTSLTVKVNTWKVASYGLDLLEYYHNREDNSYIVREGFHAETWSKYVVYTP